MHEIKKDKKTERKEIFEKEDRGRERENSKKESTHKEKKDTIINVRKT